jgi:hypothetical protein
MKKLSLLFTACLCLTLISCKTRFDNLAANSNDDVYYNPSKDPKPAAKANNAQYQANNTQQNQNNNQQQGYNPNAGKIAATHADSINPNYRDPNFNYDDYYDNAYAARVNRFQNPVYGTGYYDSYYTNQYTYTGNPSTYGSSIYSSNNYPSNMYNSYNNYGMGNYGMAGYNMYGSSMYGNGMYGSGMYGGGYGSGLSIGMGYGSMYGSGYGMGYNPFGYNYGMGMGYGMGYNPYGMGMGYGMYGMYGYGSPYGMGYGMYNPYSTMYSTGYYNPYDYNSVPASTYYGPRTTPSGGSTATASSPRSTGLREEAPIKGFNPQLAAPGVSPTSVERFNQVSIPKETMTKIAEEKSPTRFSQEYRPVTSNNFQPQNNAAPRNTFNQNSNEGGSYKNVSRPSESPAQTTQQRPTRWYNTGNSNSFNESNATRPSFNEGNSSGFSSPSRSNWSGGGSNFGGGGRSSGSFGGGGGAHMSGGGGRR